MLAAFLQRHGGSKDALLAAALLSSDPAHLRGLVARFPDDPHIQLLAIGSDAFAGERGEWVARFKAAQPDNALATILSGGDLLARGEVEAGLAQLRLATGQTRHEDFAAAGCLAIEGALIEMGYPVVDAKLNSLPIHAIRHSQRLRDSADALQQLAAAASDPEETTALATLGVALGNQLSQGRAERFGINRLVGLSVEKEFLEMLDSAMESPSFLGTPAAMIAEIDTESAALKADLALGDRLGELSEQQVVHLVHRVRTVGQPAAWIWLREQLAEPQPPAVPADH